MKARKSADAAEKTADYNALQCDRACEGAEIYAKVQRGGRVAVVLQCDRACEGAEIEAEKADATALALLQCDRACEGAEMPMVMWWQSPTLGFNVTAPVKARKSSRLIGMR